MQLERQLRLTTARYKELQHELNLREGADGGRQELDKEAPRSNEVRQSRIRRKTGL